VDDAVRVRARTARAALADGALRGPALRELIVSAPFVERDAFVDELLQIEAPPPDAPLPRGAVPYLPCGVDEILAMVRDAPVGPSDELVDLGSGLGRVAILVHLLSGARTRGIEIQEALVRGATALAARLALRDVSFVHADAAQVELDGSRFFLYAPFEGAVLARVVDRLHAVARRRRIVVGAVGLELDVPWLAARQSSNVGLAIYDALS
jgi:SAM-dependent methyltransferase